MRSKARTSSRIRDIILIIVNLYKLVTIHHHSNLTNSLSHNFKQIVVDKNRLIVDQTHYKRFKVLLWDTDQNTHEKKILFGLGARVCACLTSLGMRISTWNGIKERQRETSVVVERETSTGNC